MTRVDPWVAGWGAEVARERPEPSWGDLPPTPGAVFGGGCWCPGCPGVSRGCCRSATSPSEVARLAASFGPSNLTTPDRPRRWRRLLFWSNR